MKTYTNFNEYYKDTKGNIKSNNDDLHVFRFNEIGNNVVEKFGPFRTDFYQFAIGNTLSAEISVFGSKLFSQTFSLVIFCPGQIIEWEKTGEWDGYVVNAKPDFVARSLAEERNLQSPIISNLKPLILSINEHHYDLLKNIYEMILAEQAILKNKNYKLVQSLLSVLIQYITRIVKDKDLFSKDFEYVKQNQIASDFKRAVMNNCLSSKEVGYYANSLGTTTTILNRYVKKTFNKTPKDFINEVLLLHAKTMLSRPSASVKEVAYELNFDDYSHFVKFFKKMTGVSPAEYKKHSI